MECEAGAPGAPVAPAPPAPPAHSEHGSVIVTGPVTVGPPGEKQDVVVVVITLGALEVDSGLVEFCAAAATANREVTCLLFIVKIPKGRKNRKITKQVEKKLSWDRQRAYTCGWVMAMQDSGKRQASDLIQ